MAVNFVKVKRMIHVGENPGEKYVARLYRGQDVDLDQIAKDISESTTVSYPDVLACLKAMEIHVSKYVTEGQAVKFGLLGSFIPSIKVKAQESVDKVNSDTISRFTCRFFPSVDFKLHLAKSKFKEANLEVKGLVE